MSPPDPWALYAQTRDRFVELLGSLGPEQADLRVPLSPEWTVRGVVSHVAGMNADIASGRLTNLGTDERTAHQVAVRQGHSLDQICDEWVGHSAPVEAAMAENPNLGTRLAADLVVHLQDVQHALGLTIDQDDEPTRSAAHTYAAILRERARDQVAVDVAIEFTDGTRIGESSVLLRVSPYDFLRSITGRRSRSQVEALDWTIDPSALLDGSWSPYGELREVDVEV